VGADRALKRLTLTTAGEAATPASASLGAPPSAPVVAATTTLRDVLSLLLASGADAAAVVDAGGAPSGAVSLMAIRERAAARKS
jgi:CBS domain-containing protein